MGPDDAAIERKEWKARLEQLSRVNPEECMKWETFRGRQNTDEVLGEKASALVALISSSLDFGILFISGPGDWCPHVRIGEDETLKVMTENAALWLRVFEETAFNLLPAETHDDFMDAVVLGVGWTIAERCRENCREPEPFARLLLERYDVYGTYLKWLPEDGEGAKGTLLWEYAKQLSNIVGIGESALFNALLTNLVLTHLMLYSLHNSSWRCVHFICFLHDQPVIALERG
jgi:hypothetical protein